MTARSSNPATLQTPARPERPPTLQSDVEHRLWDRFADWLPYYPRCSAQSNAVLTRPRSHAPRYPYTTPCRTDYRAWLVFDIDTSVPYGHWDDCGLPAPNLIVRNPEKGSAHWYYAISPVYLKGRQHPIAFAKAIYQAMVTKLGADPDYAGGPVSKTPFHPRWETLCLHAEQYDLAELQDYVDLDAKGHDTAAPDDLLDLNTHSRHLWLFHATRFIAYRMVDDYYQEGSEGYERFLARFIEIAQRHNQFANRSDFGGKRNLSAAQVRAVATSIVKFCWDMAGDPARRARYLKNRGVMALDSSIPLKARQSLSAQRTHQQRQSRSATRIEVAVAALRAQGRAITFVAIATASGLSRQTVAKYRDLIARAQAKALPRPASRTISRPEKRPSKDHGFWQSLLQNAIVNFGAYKITTEGLSHSNPALGFPPGALTALPDP